MKLILLLDKVLLPADEWYIAQNIEESEDPSLCLRAEVLGLAGYGHGGVSS